MTESVTEDITKEQIGEGKKTVKNWIFTRLSNHYAGQLTLVQNNNKCKL